MTIEEIFNKLASHMVEGIMYHDDLTEAFNLLGLRGYAMCQEYHFIEENYCYKLLSRYYAKHYYKLLKLENLNQPKLIPENWYNYTTMAVDVGTKRSAVRELLTKWVEWERSTKKLYQEMRHELALLNEFAAAAFIDKLIEDVSTELRHAEKKLIYLETIGYDMITIIDHQEDLYNKYKKKLRW